MAIITRATGRYRNNSSMKRLLGMLETTSDYVDKVVAGDEPANNELGRRIADTLTAVPQVRSEKKSIGSGRGYMTGMHTFLFVFQFLSFFNAYLLVSCFSCSSSFRPEVFDRVFNNSLQDLLMVSGQFAGFDVLHLFV
jgi:hypothetical protein